MAATQAKSISDPPPVLNIFHEILHPFFSEHTLDF